MEHWKRLGWPLILGMLAAVLNWYNVTNRLEPKYYVVADSQIKAGDVVAKNMLRPVGICGDHGLSRAAIAWDQCAVLFDWRATRHLRPGDLILHRDVTPARGRKDISADDLVFTITVRDLAVPKDLFAGDRISFALGTNQDGRPATASDRPEFEFTTDAAESRQVGPFCVLAQGDGLLESDHETQRSRSDGDLTLSVCRDPDGSEKMTRLLNALNGRGQEFVLTILQHAEADAAPGVDEQSRSAGAASEGDAAGRGH